MDIDYVFDSLAVYDRNILRANERKKKYTFFYTKSSYKIK